MQFFKDFKTLILILVAFFTLCYIAILCERPKTRWQLRDAVGRHPMAHLHIEIEVPAGTWEKMEKEKNEQAHERVQKDPEGASNWDRERAANHELDNRG